MEKKDKGEEEISRISNLHTLEREVLILRKYEGTQI